MRKEKTYKRLPGQRGSISIASFMQCSLWTAENHILHIINEGYSETYKRFYYNNIQALIIHRTLTGKITNIILAVISSLLLILFAGSISKEWHIAWIVFLAVFTSLFFISLIINTIKGPTCACHIKTAVQTERLYSLNRLNQAVKAIGILRTRIEAVQGSLTDSNIDSIKTTLEKEIETRLNDTENTTPKLKIKRPLLVLKIYNSQIHKILFTTLLADCCFNYLQFFINGPYMYLIALLITTVMVITTITALIKQYGTNITVGIKILTWGTLSYLIIFNFVLSIYSSFFSFSHPDLANNTFGLYNAIYSHSPFNSVFRMIFLSASAAYSGLLGLTGTLFLYRFNKTRKIPPEISLTRFKNNESNIYE